jgi:hypothetical protein
MTRLVASGRTIGTWLGIPGEAWTLSLTSEPYGERVAVLRWLEANPNTGNVAGDLTLRHMTGDGRRRDSVVHAEHTIPNGTDGDATAYAEKVLS